MIFFIYLQFLLEDARSNEAVPQSPTKSHIPSSLDANADTTVTLPLRRPSPKEIDDKGELFNTILIKIPSKLTSLVYYIYIFTCVTPLPPVYLYT